MTRKVLAPDQYVWKQIVEWPTLYASPSIDRSRLRIFDQLFNVIGADVSNDQELLAELRRPRKMITEAQAVKYIGVPLYCGYTEARFVAGSEIPDIGAKRPIVVVEAEKADHPEVKLWGERATGDAAPWVPYPNFSAEYSTVYLAPVFRELGNAWTDAAIWFYQESMTFFQMRSADYGYAYPSNDPRKDARLIKDLREARVPYASDEEFAVAYETEFSGDFDDFARRRWVEERDRCIAFIGDTIAMLEGWKA